MIRPLAFVVLTLLPCITLAQDQTQQAETTTSALIRWQDRITSVLTDVEIHAGTPVDLGPLTVELKECRYPQGAINQDAFALLQVYDGQADAQIFLGWMVASSPAMNAVEHYRYDIWVLRCIAP